MENPPTNDNVYADFRLFNRFSMLIKSKSTISFQELMSELELSEMDLLFCLAEWTSCVAITIQNGRLLIDFDREEENPTSVFYYALPFVTKIGDIAHEKIMFQKIQQELVTDQDLKVIYLMQNMVKIILMHKDRYSNKAIFGDSQIWVRIGRLLAHLNKWDDSEIFFEFGLFLNDKNAKAWHSLGYVRYDLKNNPKIAEEHYLRALEYDSTLGFTWNNLGVLYLKNPQKLADAERCYRKAIEVDPTPAASMAWYNLGDLLIDRKQKLDEGEMCYRKAIEADPSDLTPYYRLARFYIKNKKSVEEIEVLCRKAMEIDPCAVDPYYILADYFDVIKQDSTRATEWRTKVKSVKKRDI